MKTALKAFPGKSAASESLRTHLRRWNLWTAARVIYGFAPLGSEPDWLGDDRPADPILAFPRATADGLAFFADRELQPGLFGALEPPGTTPAPAPDLILVPGLAFDRAGFRLGRGGGFYDRFLASLSEPRPVLCGVCFSCQILPAVPREPHDSRMDYLLSDKGLEPTFPAISPD